MLSATVPDRIPLTFISIDETNKNSIATSADVVDFDELMRQCELGEG